MNSIYKQLDKIDDNKSLNEKWNVKNQRELKKLKEDVQQLNETSPLVKEIQEYIHDNIFGWETIGFTDDHIYVEFEDNEYIDDVIAEINDEFKTRCELEFDEKTDSTLLIRVSISDEINEDNWASIVEDNIDYECRAKSAVLYQAGDGYTFEWVSQESMSQYDANEIARLTNNYFVLKGKLGVKIEGECFCRSYPEDSYKVRFTVKENISEDDIEDATVYEYGIVDDSEYFEEEYTTDWDEALETFNNIARSVQSRLVDVDDEEYEDHYSDGVVVRMIKGKEGSDAFDWDTIREVVVFRDYIENEEELEESVNEKRNVENQHESKKLIRESIQGSDEAIEFAKEYILDQHSWNDYNTDETESEFSMTLWCGDEWDGDESEVKYKMSIKKLVELKDDEAAFEEYIDSCENSIDYEAAGNEFYRRAEEELNKHFNCTGAFLEPSTQLGQGRTFLFADNMRFDGSFDFQTGEDYIREDNFEGFLELCKDSFTVVTDD